MIEHISKIAFWSDVPPKKDNAPGIQGVARHFCEVLGDRFSVLISHRFSRKNSRKSIADAAETADVILYPDGAMWGARRFSENFAAFMEQVLFALYLPVLAWKLRRREVDRVFVLCGADGWLIPQIRLFQKFVRIPLDLYLVDDIEDWIAHKTGHPLAGRIHDLLGAALQGADRVFAISPGFKDHLAGRFGVKVEWLPLPSSSPPPAYVPEPPSVEEHALTFIGSFSYLYADALRDVYSAICDLNESQGGLQSKPLVLEILSAADSGPFEQTLPHTRWLRIGKNLPDDECLARFRRALACLLPYSFSERERLMVSTSFSCKILDYFKSGRPILAYGPSYASIPRYFSENGWPLCARNFTELASAICSIPAHDNAGLAGLYAETWERRHSGKAIRSILVY